MMITQPVYNFRNLSFAITMLAVLCGCGGHPIEPQERYSKPRPIVSMPEPQTGGPGTRAAAVALDQVGVPYRYGGSDRSGFDCSGLVQYSYSHAGVRVPRTTGQLWDATSSIKQNQLRAGDLLFFNIEGKMAHVGLYIGGGEFVHAPSSGRRVSVENLASSYYAQAFIRGGRIK